MIRFDQNIRPCNEQLRQRDIAYRWKMPLPELVNQQQQKKVGECWTYGLSIKQRLDIYRNSFTKPKHVDRSKWGMPQSTQYQWGQSTNNKTNSTPKGPTMSDGPFFDNLKKRGIQDQVLCILAQQGIKSSNQLNQISQESLVAVGIRLADVIKLKQI